MCGLRNLGGLVVADVRVEGRDQHERLVQKRGHALAVDSDSVLKFDSLFLNDDLP